MVKTYDAYKDSGIAWIGKIPKKWIVGLVGKYFEEVNNPNINQEETNTLQFKMGEIISKSKGDSKYSPETIEAYNVVMPGTIMIYCLNLSFDLISQRVAQVREKGAITSTYLAIFPTKEMKSDYAKYLLKAYDNNKALHAMGRGLRATLSYRTFRSEPVVVPSLDEQQSISSFLDRKCSEIDSLVSLQEEMISELQAYKQSVITEAVTKGLDPNVPMKDSGVEWIDIIPEGWEVLPFKSVFYTEKGLNITKADLTENGVPVLSYGQIHSKQNPGTRLNGSLFKFVPKSYLKTNPECLVQKGCFLIADTSEDYEGCGNAIYVDRNMMLFAGYHTIVARPCNLDRDYKYFAYLLLTNNWRQQVRSRVSGIKVYSINQKILKQTSLLFPPLQEQQAIASYLDEKTSQIDSLIEIKREKITELKDYKKSIIYEYVTGKKKV